MKNLDIARQPIGELLTNRQFIVPTYQRSFAWTTLHVENLVKDINAAMARMSAGKGDKYFLGTIVFIERAERRLEVVDGQQRLATVSILLAAMRDYHLARGKKRQARDYDKFLRYLHPSGKYKPRLSLNESDNRCFEKEIVMEPPQRQPHKWAAPSHLRILAAYEVAQKFVRSIADTNTPSATIKRLHEIKEFLANGTMVIHITVDTDADAFTIFETLNDRNAHLTVADLLKNFLFGMSGDSMEETKGHWKEMQGALASLRGKREKTVDYIRQLWVSMHGLVREKDLFRSIKERITDESEAVEFAHQIAAQAAEYVAVLNQNHEMWDGYGAKAKAALVTFNTLRVERVRPLLLAILRKFDKKERVKALIYLRSATVRIIMTTGINGTVEEELFAAAVKVHSGKVRKASQLAKAMESFVPNDAMFEARVANMTLTKDSLARFYLQEIQDTSATDDDGRVVDRDESRVDLEHVIPTSATERAKHWPELSPELGQALCKRFGNLTLIRRNDNSRLNGKAFAEKLPVYDRTKGLPLTNEIARDYNQFGEDEVHRRQCKLAKLALRTWPIEVG